MLVDCPKCHFSQPQDQYCAKCGIDMQAYRPKPAPVQVRLLANPVFLVAVVFVFVFSGALYIIKEQRRTEITRRMDYLKNGPIYAESLQAAKPASAESSQTVEESATDTTMNISSTSAPISPPPPPAAQAIAARGEIAEEADLSSLGGASPTSEAEASATAAKSRPITLRAHYALSIRPRLAAMVDASRNQSQFIDFGEFQMGTLRGVKNYLSQLDVMESVQKKFDTGTGEQMWFVGDRNIEPPLGLTTKIAIRSQDASGLRGEIEILRSLHESPDFSQGIVAKAFGPGEFAVPPQAGLIIVLQLPRVPQYDERSVSPAQFLRLFRMPEFKQSQSEFVLLIDFDAEGSAPDSPRPSTAR